MAMDGVTFSTSDFLDTDEDIEIGTSSVLEDSDDTVETTEAAPVEKTSDDSAPVAALPADDEDTDELADTLTLSAPAIMGAVVARTVISGGEVPVVRAEIGTSLRMLVQGLLPAEESSTPDKAVADADSWADYALALIPSDDLFPNQWHLQNTGQSGGDAGVDLNVTSVWDDYTGAGVTVGIWDDGVQYTHHDLDDNYDTNLHIVVGGVTHDPLPQSFQSAHGTAVAGVIAAENNGEGTVGVAYDATIAGVDMFFDNSLDFEASFYELDNFDVTNHSWGWVTPFADSIYDTNSTGGVDWQEFFGGFFESVETGRGGLGTINLVANGNDRTIGRDGNDSNFNSIPQTIAVGATSHDGYVSYYSTPGANLLISSPSNGAEGAGIWTTDRTGFWGYDRGGDYTSTFGGTSSATPAAAGVVALMLEANPELGWRDVQDILALSARHTGSAMGSGPEADELYTWEFNGATNWNGGGMHFSNDYGFGLIDALAAVRLAETWVDQKTSSNWEDPVVASGNFNLVIPDNNATGISFTFDTTDDFDIEHVGLTLGFSGGYTGDYNITLISPDGTESVLAITGNQGSAATTNWFFMSNAFRGETSAGTWTVEISDETAGDTGTLTYGELQFFGETADADDLYVYTNEFSDFAGVGNHLLTLNDTNGGIDTLNAAAVTAASIITLGGTATIDGQLISSVTGIENVFGGDGDDTLTGDDAANILAGGRGNDLLSGGRGDDILRDGEGQDILKGQAGNDIYELCIDDSKDNIRSYVDGADRIRFVEGDLEFSDLIFTDIQLGKVRIDYADDFVIVVNSNLGLTSADFDISDFLFA
ncbi:MAG: furin [Rhodobacteraceae bacterium]|nr:furin [Paracoccaceae bacterium]